MRNIRLADESHQIIAIPYLCELFGVGTTQAHRTTVPPGDSHGRTCSRTGSEFGDLTQIRTSRSLVARMLLNPRSHRKPLSLNTR